MRAIVLSVYNRKSRHKTVDLLTADGKNMVVRLPYKQGYKPQVGNILDIDPVIKVNNVENGYDYKVIIE